MPIVLGLNHPPIISGIAGLGSCRDSLYWRRTWFSLKLQALIWAYHYWRYRHLATALCLQWSLARTSFLFLVTKYPLPPCYVPLEPCFSLGNYRTVCRSQVCSDGSSQTKHSHLSRKHEETQSYQCLRVLTTPLGCSSFLLRSHLA